MRIAYLSVSKIPSREANSIHVMKMCQAFTALGHEVTLLAPDVRRGTEPGISDVYRFYGVEPTFAVRKVRWSRLRGRGLIYGWESGRLAAQLDPDVAVGRSLHACAVAACSGVPTVWDAHMLRFLDRAIDRWLFHAMVGARAFKAIVVNCEALGRDIAAQVPRLKKPIVVAHNGADPLPEGLEPADLGRTDGRLQVGYVGQLYEGKGFELIPALAHRAPWADFHIVGGDEHAVERARRGAPLPANIRLHGFVPPADVGRLCLAFDVLMAPYQAQVGTAGGGETSAWLSPMKVFGYMAAGKPILCSDLAVLHEVIENDRNGLLLPPEDPEKWAAALQHLRDVPADRRRLGEAARSDLMARYLWRHRASRVLDAAMAVRTSAAGRDGSRES